MGWQIELLNNYDQWKSRLESAQKKTLFHSIDELYTSRDFTFVILAKDNNPVLGVPLLKRKNYFVTVLDSCLHTLPYLGFVIFDEQTFNFRRTSEVSEGINLLTKFIGRGLFTVTRIMNPPYFFDVRPFLWNGWDAKISYTFITEPRRIDQLLGSKTRKWLRKALNSKPDIQYDINWDSFLMQYEHFSLERGFYTKEGLNVVESLVHLKEKGFIKATQVSIGQDYSVEVMLIDPSHKVAYRMYSISTKGSLEKCYDYLALHEAIRNLQTLDVEKVYLLAAPSSSLSTFVSKFASGIESYFWLIYAKQILPDIVLRKLGVQVYPWL
jgi:hypothetical protein